jgi:very-short-patch-repair endonuclease
MNITIDGIGTEQDTFLLGIKKGEELWNCENKLKNILEQLFTKDQIIHNKKIILKEKSYFPDYRMEPSKTVVEFQGYQHYTNSKIAYLDIIRKKHFLDNGYKFIEIPYFVQLTSKVIKFLFSKTIIKYSTNFPHGFIHPKSIVIGDFCKLGLLKTKDILDTFPEEVRIDCFKSLEFRALKDNIPLNIYNPLLDE